MTSYIACEEFADKWHSYLEIFRSKYQNTQQGLKPTPTKEFRLISVHIMVKILSGGDLHIVNMTHKEE